MKHPDYPNVSSFVDNRGATRWRFRKGKFKPIYLPGEPHSAEFDATFKAVVDGLILPQQRFPGARCVKDRYGESRYWYVRPIDGGKEIRIEAIFGTPQWESEYRAARGNDVSARPTSRPVVRGNFPRRIEHMLRQLRLRSLGLQREFDLSQEWLIAELERCDYRCSITGIPFQADRVDGKRCNPFAPSIDRIDNSRGYTPDNVRLVLTSVNLALSDFGVEHFDELCRARIMKLLESLHNG